MTIHALKNKKLLLSNNACVPLQLFDLKKEQVIP